MSAPRIPVATYRLQMNGRFRFADAEALVPYLARLGVTELYSSPILAARPGSTHGYDVTDPRELNPELGTEEDWERLHEALREHDLGLLLDIVPNHAGVGHDNPLWMDVLENGPSSEWACAFDVDWKSAKRRSGGRIVLPVLGSPYGEVLERGELVLEADDAGRVFVRYWDKRFPIDPGTLGLGLLPGREDVAASRERRTAVAALRRELAGSAPLRELVERHNADRDLLDDLLSRQAYRLAYWRTGSKRINYRRFFDVNDLVGVRVETPRVFEMTHAKILELVRAGKVTGLRIDHVDGLRDPAAYLERLHERACEAAGSDDFYVVVEKILTGDEQMPAEFRAHGTTGYDFLKLVNGVFADEEGVRTLDRFYERFTGVTVRFEDLVYGLKRRILHETFPGELGNLCEHLARLAECDRHACDIEAGDLVEAVAAVTAALPVYRTYVRDGAVSERDRRYLEQALAEARARTAPALGPALAFVGRVLLRESARSMKESEGRLKFVQRWQQLTGPVMAKGLEDTALYVYNRLVSLNVIGGRRSKARSVGELHAFNARRLEHEPRALNATSTHDTKRSEDVQARIHVLSEIADEWTRAVERWHRLNRAKRPTVRGERVPDANEEMLVYQTLVGAWPLEEGARVEASFRDRVKAYLVKATREAKVHTSWTSPDEEHERALLAFVDAILEPRPGNRFRRELLELTERVSWHGAVNSLAQTLVKIASPGVPDLYQGTELWDLSLVDPDNRRPVDWKRRQRLLDELDRRTPDPSELLASWKDGRVKLFLTSRALRFRRENAPLFQGGAYLPLTPVGPARDHVCAFARRLGPSWAVAIAPRLLVRHASWERTQVVLPAEAPRAWVDVVTGARFVRTRRSLPVGELLARFPVALLAPGE